MAKFKDDRTGPGTLAGRFSRSLWWPVHVTADLDVTRIKIRGEDHLIWSPSANRGD
jgi:hypothetical protein